MAKKIDVIKVDPFEETIEEILIEESDGDAYREVMKCRLFDIVRLDNGVTMVVDDEGLLKNPTRYFAIEGNTYAGIALLTGEDKNGNLTAPPLTLGKAREKIKFVEKGYSKEPFMTFVPMNVFPESSSS